jgi:hypothetical protein
MLEELQQLVELEVALMVTMMVLYLFLVYPGIGRVVGTEMVVRRLVQMLSELMVGVVQTIALLENKLVLKRAISKTTRTRSDDVGSIIFHLNESTDA